MCLSIRLVGVGCLVAFCAVAAGQATGPAQTIDYDTLKLHIAAAVKEDPQRAKLDLHVAENTLYYDPRQLHIKTPSGQSDAVRQAILAQFEAVAFKEYVANDQNIDQAVTNLEAYAKRLITAPKRTKKDVDDLKELETKALTAIAQAKGAKAGIETIDHMTNPLAFNKVKVTFKLNPMEGGITYYISAFERCLNSEYKEKDPNDLSTWYQVGKGGASLYGTYYFAAKWENKVTYTVKMKVTEASTIELSK